MKHSYTINQLDELAVLLAKSCDQVRDIWNEARNGDIKPTEATNRVEDILETIEEFQ